MKKSKLLFCCVILFTVILSACGGSKDSSKEEANLETIYNKIDNWNDNDSFTQQEYALMADYIVENWDEISSFNDLDQLDQIEEKYPRALEIWAILEFANKQGELDKETSAKIQKLEDSIMEQIYNNEDWQESQRAIEEEIERLNSYYDEY